MVLKRSTLPVAQPLPHPNAGRKKYGTPVAGLLGAKSASTGKGKFGSLLGAAIGVALMLVLDAKFWGVIVMGASVVILAFLPWLDQSPARSIRYRPGFHKLILVVFVINFAILGYLGIQAPTPLFERMSQVGTVLYFAFFLLMPWWSRKGTFKPVPTRVNFKAH